MTSLVVEMTTSALPALGSVEGVLSRLRLNLEELDRLATPRNTPRVVWGVARLSQSLWSQSEDNQLIRVELLPRPMAGERPSESVGQIAIGLVQGVNALRDSPRIPENFSTAMLGRVQEITTSGQAGGISVVEVTAVNGQVNRGRIDGVTHENARTATSAAVTVVSSVTGVLDVINLRRRGTPKAQVYDARSRHATAVIAGPGDAERLGRALGKRVTIGGMLIRNSMSQAVSITLEDLVEMPDLKGRVTAADLFRMSEGADFTEGLSTQDYMDWLRHRDRDQS